MVPGTTGPQVPLPSPPIDQADIARLLQAHLKRVGCNFGNVDGKWDDSSRKALELFNRNAHTEFDVKLASLDALDAVRGKQDRVCPVVCAKGERAEGVAKCPDLAMAAFRGFMRAPAGAKGTAEEGLGFSSSRFVRLSGSSGGVAGSCFRPSWWRISLQKRGLCQR